MSDGGEGIRRLLWIGPRTRIEDFTTLLAQVNIQLVEFGSADAALQATAGVDVSAAVVSADWGGAAAAVHLLREKRSDIQILVATKLGVPLHLGVVLREGATKVLDLQAADAAEIADQINDAMARHQTVVRERVLLLQLRSLNEEFLRNMVNLERRALEFEDRLRVEEENADGTELSEGPYRVLIVDDEPAICQMLKLVLRKTGYEIETAHDAESALEVFRSYPYHLVITDKNLPGMTGVDLLREIKAIQPDTEVIIITGYASQKSAMDSVNRGASAYIEKPFRDTYEVKERIEEVANRQQEKQKKRRHLQVFKKRNAAFLEQYHIIRAELETVIKEHGDQGQVPGDEPT